MSAMYGDPLSTFYDTRELRRFQVIAFAAGFSLGLAAGLAAFFLA